MSDEQLNDPTQTQAQAPENPQAFFQTWALWEKMCFVLLLAIVFVCIAGFVKSSWKAHILRVYERRDRDGLGNGPGPERVTQMAEGMPSNDFLFGIRALESGLEIDGIWISRNNSPIPEDLKQVRRQEQNSSASVESNGESIRPKTSEEGKFSASRSHYSLSPVEGIFHDDPCSTAVPAKLTNVFIRPEMTKDYSEFSLTSRQSTNMSRNDLSQYKPRRSSQLRFSSCGATQYHEETLSRLEGNFVIDSHASCDLDTQRKGHFSSDAATADNECSSGSSSENEDNLSGKQSAAGTSPPFDEKYSIEAADAKFKGHDVHSQHKSSSFFRPQSSSGFAFLPIRPPSQESPNPFKTPKLSPLPVNTILTNSARPSSKDSDILNDTQWPLLSDEISTSPEPSQFRTGQVRANKSVRKVNSGFEILPAGTFGPSIAYGDGGAFSGDFAALANISTSGKKLQKRVMNSERSSFVR